MKPDDTVFLRSNPPDWAALAAEVQAAWHTQAHLQAGRWRLTQVQLRLGAPWPVRAGRLAPALAAVLRQVAASGASVQVLQMPGQAQPQLGLGWAPWHAPPLQDLPAQPAMPPYHFGDLTMKLRDLFTQRQPDTSATADEPSLQPQGVRAPLQRQQQLSQALARIGETIAEQEVQELRDTVPECRYRLHTLTLWVTAANAPALRGLMDLAQRNPAVAQQHLDKCFARGTAARLLDTTRTRLDFQRSDSLPPDAGEVLLVQGRAPVPVPFSYTGEVVLGDADKPGVPSSAAAAPASAPAARPGAATAAAGPELLIWAQPAAGGTLCQWRFAGCSVSVGAADDAMLRIDQPHVSGRHLELRPGPGGQWWVEDLSRNGTRLFDAAAGANPAEQPLPPRQAVVLPQQGALRLGPLPADPLLHFVLRNPDPPAPLPDAWPRRRSTQIANAPLPGAAGATKPVDLGWPQPSRATGTAT